MTTVEEDKELVVAHMHPLIARDRRLPAAVFDAVFVKGDGFGAGLSRETLARINSGADYSHVRDSTPGAWKAMAAELRARGWAGRPGDPGPPLFVDVDGPTALRPRLPVVERDAILAIVEHWADGSVLGLRWPTVGWETLVTGGVEPGQTAEEAALAEIAQETGWLSAKLQAVLPPVEAKFFHEAKGQNRHARFAVMAFRLLDDRRAPVEAAEAAMHVPEWLDQTRMASFRLPPAQRHAFHGWRRSLL